jgi:hypothetical protein
VITSNQVVIWALLGMLGLPMQGVRGGGVLFDRLEAAA